MNDQLPRITFDLDALRSFAMGIELGGFAKAADRIGRSASAISAHLKKLEDRVGAPILKKAGRGLVLTPAGELLLSYAKRLLELNDEAAIAVRGVELSGTARIGLQEDFGEHLLSRMLGEFARAHPRLSVEAHVVRNAQLLQLLGSGRLDLALAWSSGESAPRAELLGKLPLCWIGPQEGSVVGGTARHPLPLVMFELPCLMRSAATAALDRAGIRWRIALTSMSLSGIWAAVAAGLGITVRTRAGLPDGLRVRDDLPKLPAVGLVLHHAEAKPSKAIERLAEIVRETVHGLLGRANRPA